MLRTSASRSLRCASTRLQPRIALTSARFAPTLSNSMITPRYSSSSATTNAAPLFRLDPPTEAEEAADFAAQVDSISSWFASPRFAGLKRPYSAELVATKRGTQPISPLHSSNISAQKLHAALSRAASKGLPLPTMGAIDPIQMTQMAPHLEVLYVSGWAASSVLTTGNNEVGPDLADYPYTTVPNQVQRLRKAQEMHDRKMWDERRNGKGPWVDYLRPIIADGDTGLVSALPSRSGFKLTPPRFSTDTVASLRSSSSPRSSESRASPPCTLRINSTAARSAVTKQARSSCPCRSTSRAS